MSWWFFRVIENVFYTNVHYQTSLLPVGRRRVQWSYELKAMASIYQSNFGKRPNEHRRNDSTAFRSTSGRRAFSRWGGGTSSMRGSGCWIVDVLVIWVLPELDTTSKPISGNLNVDQSTILVNSYDAVKMTQVLRDYCTFILSISLRFLSIPVIHLRWLTPPGAIACWDCFTIAF